MKNLNEKTTTGSKSRSVEETLTVELAEVFGRISNRKHQKNTLIALTVILKSFLNGELYGRDISKILSKELLFENYDELTKQGISIDINKLMTVFWSGRLLGYLSWFRICYRKCRLVYSAWCFT